MYKSLIAAWNVGITTCACNQRRHELRERNERGLWNSFIFIFLKSLFIRPRSHVVRVALPLPVTGRILPTWVLCLHQVHLRRCRYRHHLLWKNRKKKNKNYKILTDWVPNDEMTKFSSSEEFFLKFVKYVRRF